MSEDSYVRLKDQGNEKFKLKRYDEAISLYTRAISINSGETVAYTNRALCFINMQRFFEAKEDCDKAISIDSNLVKAFYRRAIANRGLFRYRDAIKDFIVVIDLDPSFTLATKEMNDLEMQLKQDSRLIVKTTAKPRNLCSERPLRKFHLLNQFKGTKNYK